MASARERSGRRDRGERSTRPAPRRKYEEGIERDSLRSQARAYQRSPVKAGIAYCCRADGRGCAETQVEKVLGEHAYAKNEKAAQAAAFAEIPLGGSAIKFQRERGQKSIVSTRTWSCLSCREQSPCSSGCITSRGIRVTSAGPTTLSREAGNSVRRTTQRKMKISRAYRGST